MWTDWRQSGDLSHVVFVKASDGLVLISTTGLDEMIRGALEEYEAGHYTAEEAVEAIEAILDSEEIREILESYRSGTITTTEALSSILDLTGVGHVEHDDHGHDEHGHDEHADTEDMDEHGHDEHADTEDTDEHGHDEHGHDGALRY